MLFWILVGGASTYFGVKYLSKALDTLEDKYFALGFTLTIFGTVSLIVCVGMFFEYISFVKEYEILRGYVHNVVGFENIHSVLDIYELNETLIGMKASRELWGSLSIYPATVLDIPLIGVG